MTLRDIQRRLARLLPHLFLAAVLGYFAYHIVHGERGMLRSNLLTRTLDEREVRLAALSEQHDVLAARVGGLRRGSLDLDLLEERARLVLGYGAEGDAMILLPERGLIWKN